MSAAEARRSWGRNTGIGVLRMRRDGFVAATADLHAWTADLAEMPRFVTVPLGVGGPPNSCNRCELTLRLNVETGASGTVAVELRDPQTNEPLPGHSLSTAERIYGNWLSRAARWNGTQSLEQSVLAGREVRLLVVMQDARLFSLSFEYRNSSTLEWVHPKQQVSRVGG